MEEDHSNGRRPFQWKKTVPNGYIKQSDPEHGGKQGGIKRDEDEEKSG
jgi:hypothetical protein